MDVWRSSEIAVLHRNTQKRMYFDGAIYFVTTVTKARVPWFHDRRLAEVVLEQIHTTKKLKGFLLFAYVIMPDHLHLLLQPNTEYSISAIMFTIKKQFAHEANRMLGWNAKAQRSASPAGEQTFVRLREMVNTRPPPQNPQGKRFQWQTSFHDHIIRDQEDFNRHMNYILYNPVKDGLVSHPEAWPHSSYQDFVNENYLLIDSFPFD